MANVSGPLGHVEERPVAHADHLRPSPNERGSEVPSLTPHPLTAARQSMALTALQAKKRAQAVGDRHEAALDGVGVEARVRVQGGPRVEPPRNVVQNPCHTRGHARGFERLQGGRRSLRPLGPLWFKCSQHWRTLRPSVERVCRKALLPFGSVALRCRCSRQNAKGWSSNGRGTSLQVMCEPSCQPARPKR